VTISLLAKIVVAEDPPLLALNVSELVLIVRALNFEALDTRRIWFDRHGTYNC